MNKEDILLKLNSKKDLICGVSDRIWENAETKFREHKSAEILCEALKGEGFTVETNLADIPTAFKGTFGSGSPVIGILGEYDALFGLSQKADVFQQEAEEAGAPGHGCGHNLLGAGSFAAAVAVKEYLQETGQEGTVIYFGCPGEEGGSGKAFMARDGVFDGVDIALSWHPDNMNSVWSFTTLANVQVRYKFKGISSHAGMSPHMGRSALDAVELMNVGVQFLREHIISDARIHYAITDTGGNSPNVVQGYSEVLYLIRAPHNNQLVDIYQRVDDIARGAALMTGTQVEIEMEKACSNIMPNNVLEALLYENMKNIQAPTFTEEEQEYAKKMAETVENRVDLVSKLAPLGPKARQLAQMHNDKYLYDFILPYMGINVPVPGSSDVGDVSWVCPTAQIITTTLAAGTVNHSWQQVAQGKNSIAHKGTMYAGQVLAGAAIDLLNNPETVEAAKKEFRERVGEAGYKPLMPKSLKPVIN